MPPMARPSLSRLATVALPALAVGTALGVVWSRSGSPSGGDHPEPAVHTPPLISWRPAQPDQGKLFVVRVTIADGEPTPALTGEVAGEALHFEPVGDGAFESLAAMPVDAETALEVSVTAIFPDGARAVESAEVPVTAGTFSHEHLTVAPRFGTPLDSADQARLDRDQAKAREVALQAHATPRLWTPDVVLPRNARVTSGFGNGREFNGQISSRHLGLDLDGNPGDTVVAATRGVVALVDSFLLAGNIVYLNHGGGLLSGYFHLTRALVVPGDTVEAGTPIGLVGATGRVTGPHLHWVVRYGETSVDPRSLLEVR